MSRIVASPCTIGGIADDTVMPANAATQIQVNSVVIFANSAALDHLFWLVDFGELPHERPADQHAGQRDEEDPGVAQRLHPPLHERLAQRERQYRQHQKRCNSADFESASRRYL